MNAVDQPGAETMVGPLSNEEEEIVALAAAFGRMTAPSTVVAALYRIDEAQAVAAGARALAILETAFRAPEWAQAVHRAALRMGPEFMAQVDADVAKITQALPMSAFDQ